LRACARYFTVFFVSIPHDWYWKTELARYEGFYASIFYCYFAVLGLDVRVEEATNQGRLDMAVLFEGWCYLFEFKVVEDKSEGKALLLLREKRYWRSIRVSAKRFGSLGLSSASRRGISFLSRWKRSAKIRRPLRVSS